ncbi:hypothetical protein DdX_20672 [Ditylenchus destructor]|uniref:Uncharacterized protein n=1 Tax=Ditylenchus destructor TaxID=166010 RepID=A0AAD4QVY0_9BILA|nr:hypothetical protein DdX_20672 [Ditylenchus destructor]
MTDPGRRRRCGAAGKHHETVGRRHQGVHQVLDPEDGDAALMDRDDQLQQLLHLAVGQPTGHLVEQQQARLRRDRTCELEALSLQQRERARQLVRDGREGRSARSRPPPGPVRRCGFHCCRRSPGTRAFS